MESKHFGPLILIAGAIAAPILAAQVLKTMVKAPPATPQEAVDDAKHGIYTYGALAAGAALIAGYTSGGVQAAALGAALSTGVLAGAAASVVYALPPLPAAAPPVVPPKVATQAAPAGLGQAGMGSAVAQGAGAAGFRRR